MKMRGRHETRSTRGHVWLKNTRQLWKSQIELWAELFVFFCVGLSLFGLALSFVRPRPVLVALGTLWAGAIALGLVARLIAYHAIKCPRCRHNPTRRQKDGRPLNANALHKRLAELEACPECGYRGKGEPPETPLKP